jgi:hypothetical protein
MQDVTIIKCSDCGREYRVRSEVAGKRRKCKDCGGIVAVPDDTPDDSYDGYDESGSGSSSDEEYEPYPRPRKRRQSPKDSSDRGRGNSRKKAKRKRQESKHQTVATGLRCVLVSLLIQIAAFLIGLLPVSIPYLSFGLSQAASVLALVGQVMCLAVPEESGTRPLFIGVVALQVLGIGVRFGIFAIPLLGLFWLLSSSASFFLFVYALKRLSEFVESPKAEADAEWILQWGVGLLVLREVPSRVAIQLGPGVAGIMVWVIVLATLVIGVLILLRYIDLLGNLKDDLSDL